MELSTEEQEMRQEQRQQMFGRPDAGPPAGLLEVPPGLATASGGGNGLDSTFDLSHELRTSLAVVTLISGNLDRLYERRKMIRDLRQHTHRLNSVVGDLLTLPGDCDPHPI
jgi:hypothetical protein